MKRRAPKPELCHFHDGSAALFFYFLRIFCSFTFHFNQHFLPDSFYVHFIDILKKNSFRKFQTFTKVFCVIIVYIRVRRDFVYIKNYLIFEL